ncbi:MAG: permease-like cell division protein FtsX [Candidatus Doudnabacteria bacterium]
MSKILITFFRIIKNGVINLKRNLWLAGASTLIMTITLVILSVLSLLFVITNYSVKSIQQRVDISAYFKDEISESQILVVRDELLKDTRITAIDYVSSEEAQREFRQRHQDDQLITDSLDELTENPFPATLQIKADNLEDFSAIDQLLKSDQFSDKIKEVNFEDNRVIIDRLNTLLTFIITFGIILITVFCLIAVLVMFNTLALTIYNRREEVEIMRLVGATNWYIRGPFIVEAFLYSIFAAAITGILLTPIYFSMLPKISQYLTPGESIFDGNLMTFGVVIIVQLLIAFTLSTISSLLAMRKYLRI